MKINVSSVQLLAVIIFFMGFWISRSLMFVCFLFIYLALALKIMSGVRLKNVTSVEVIFIILIFTALPASVLYYDIEEYIKTLLIPLTLYFASRNYSVTPNFLRNVLLIILGSFLLISSILLFQVGYRVFDFNILNAIQRDRFGGYYLVSDSSLGPNIFSIALSVVAITSYSISFTFSGLKKYALFMIMLLALFLIMTVASRTVSVALVFILVMNQILANNGQFRFGRAFSKIPIAVLLLTIFVLSVYSYLPDSFSERYSVLTTLSADGSLMTRFMLWENAINLFINNPIFGVGYSTMMDTFGMTAHNEFLAHFVAGGVFTGLFVFMLYFIIGKNILKAFLCVNEEAIFFVRFSISIFLLTMFFGLTEHFSFSYSALYYPVIWLVFGFCQSLTYSHNKRKLS